MTNRLRFIVADDHRMFADALCLLLQPLGDVVGVAGTLAEAVTFTLDRRPDVLITDISMPDGSGLDVIRRIRRAGNRLPVLVVTVHADAIVQHEALSAGANGYLLKSAAFSDLVHAITTVRNGGIYLTTDEADEGETGGSLLDRLSVREHEVLEGLAQGRTAQEIADRLGISRRTVVFHKERMRQRLGVSTTVDAVNLFRSLACTR